jgi:hypothetical protein
MGSLQEKLTRLIQQHLPESACDLETLPGGRVSGHVVSSRFEGQSFEDRRQVWRCFVEAHLESDEQARVSTVFFYTPAEYSFAA